MEYVKIAGIELPISDDQLLPEEASIKTASDSLPAAIKDQLALRKVAKLEALLCAACTINKLAAINNDPVTSDEQISKVVARADEKMPDSIATTMSDPNFISAVIQNLKEAAEEMVKEDAAASVQTPSAKPDDFLVLNGTGEVSKQIAGNPHANTGGISMASDIKIMETNLTAPGGTPMSQKVASLEMVQALTVCMQKLAEDVEIIKKEVEKAQNRAVTPAEKDGTSPAQVAANVSDPSLIVQASPTPAELSAASIPVANPNPEAQKLANTKDLLSIVAKYKK